MHHSNRCALTSCSAPLPSGKKYVAIELLTKEILYFVVDLKTKGQELFEQVCNYLGLNDSELFGLALYTGDEYQFIDPTLKISKTAPKSWKAQHGYGVDDSGKPLLTLHFKIQYYVDCHLLINDKITRHFYYLQLLQNVINYSQSLSKERALLLTAYALQADFGNYNRDRHKDKYFDPKKYFPERIIQNLGEEYIIKHTPAMHKDNTSLSRGEAQVMYIKEASDSTAPHNLHFYKMHRKKTKADSNVWLAICAKGIEIYEENNVGLKSKLSTFLWPDIAKLYFEKKKFEIRSVGCPEERKFTYYASSEDLAKSLLWLCRMTHQFHMVTQTRVQELKQLELEGHKPYRESYIYSDSLDMAWEKRQREHQDQSTLQCSVSRLKKMNTTNNSNEQRVSVISSTSSNTTSGIVSDRIQSFDESEDDIEIENLTPLISHNLNVTSVKNRQLGMENKDNGSQCSERSEHSSSVESGMGDQLSVPSSGYWNTDGKRTTPTSSLLSGGSYTSFTDSTHSSSSQLSAITVKANLISPRVGAFSNRNCCSNSCCSNVVNDDDSNSDKIKNFTKKDVKMTDVKPQCSFVEQNQSIKNNSNTKNGFNKLSPQEIELLLEKQLYQRQQCIHKYMHNTLPSLSFSDKEISSSSCLEKPYDHVHVIGALCNKKNLKEISVSRQKNFGDNSHSPLYSSTPTISHQSQIFNQEPYANYSSSLKFQSLPLHSVINPVASTSHLHTRNATRIGVSSLTRQRIPLSIFNYSRVPMMTTASEPNLCCSNALHEHHCISSVNSKASSNNSLQEGNSVVQNSSCDTVEKLLDNSPYSNCTQSENNLDTVDFCNNTDSSLDLNNFPCIPPPLAYRTSSDKGVDDINLPRHCIDEIHSCHQNCVHRNIPVTYFSKSLESLPSFIDGKQLTSKDTNSSCSTERLIKFARKYESIPSLFKNGISDSTDILDLQQLREKSKDLDLPLISALCNDRSLLMLPKTVPTCSRQRHIGTKDFRRFSCSYINSLQSSRMKNLSEMTKSSFGSLDRPVSWHLESSDYLWLKDLTHFSEGNKTILNQGTGSSLSNEFNNTYPFASSHFHSELHHSHTTYCQHPSSIFASFSTLSDDHLNNGYFEHLNKNMHAQRQLIPRKLSFAQGCNGRLYAKEQTS
ncbi:uncharacterized protein [Centruroides vittatus]|uniref:uncharacterized protein isoform X1 n=1 Tax=Centruroides vittatus TaxID=120091 RepID=UPI00350EF4D4